MSRSYKHTRYCGQTKNREMKRIASHKLRQRLKDPEFSVKGNDYKKVVESYDICDYYHIEHRGFDAYYESVISRWEQFSLLFQHYKEKHPVPPTREEVWNEYQKIYMRK